MITACLFMTKNRRTGSSGNGLHCHEKLFHAGKTEKQEGFLFVWNNTAGFQDPGILSNE